MNKTNAALHFRNVHVTWYISIDAFDSESIFHPWLTVSVRFCFLVNHQLLVSFDVLRFICWTAGILKAPLGNSKINSKWKLSRNFVFPCFKDWYWEKTFTEEFHADCPFFKLLKIRRNNCLKNLIIKIFKPAAKIPRTSHMYSRHGCKPFFIYTVISRENNFK